MTIDKEFIVQRQGKAFALYAGLLDAAHDAGLISIETQLIQVPSEDNYQTAICTARVSLASEGKVRSFTGIGDASPSNVAKLMIPHIIRMAETRAKARALRDAVNVGVAALEETEGDDEHESTAVRAEERAALRRAAEQQVAGAQRQPVAELTKEDYLVRWHDAVDAATKLAVELKIPEPDWDKDVLRTIKAKVEGAEHQIAGAKRK